MYTPHTLNPLRDPKHRSHDSLITSGYSNITYPRVWLGYLPRNHGDPICLYLITTDA